jgi:hypothetical protein
MGAPSSRFRTRTRRWVPVSTRISGAGIMGGPPSSATAATRSPGPSAVSTRQSARNTSLHQWTAQRNSRPVGPVCKEGSVRNSDTLDALQRRP